MANITFNENSNIDHNARLNCSSADKKKRRSEISPAKQTTSPAKDHQTEVYITSMLLLYNSSFSRYVQVMTVKMMLIATKGKQERVSLHERRE